MVGLTVDNPPTFHGQRLRRGALLEYGARVDVPPHGHIRIRRGNGVFVFDAGRARIECRAPQLRSGRAEMLLKGRGRAQLLFGKDLVVLRTKGRVVTNSDSRRVRFRRGKGFVAAAGAPASTVRAHRGDVVIVGGGGLPRMNTWPFARSPDQRSLEPAGITRFWADGLACSTGCRPAGALRGWPLKPFHEPHPLRSGLNEWRPADMHIGIDIQALDGTRVYAVQSGHAELAGRGTVDSRVSVGQYEYWHVRPSVRSGQYVRAHRTVIGHILRGAGHLHFSETRGDGYLNPLRPGGRVLAPYRDSEEPIVGRVTRAGAAAFVEAFDPQSVRATIRYRTPVTAPAAIAWRARDANGDAISALQFAYRGSHHYPPESKKLVYGPGTTPPDNPDRAPGGWSCFWRHVVCVPKWNYRIGALPLGTRAVTVYAWDWAGNVAARTTSFVHAARTAASVPPERGDPLSAYGSLVD